MWSDRKTYGRQAGRSYLFHKMQGSFSMAHTSAEVVETGGVVGQMGEGSGEGAHYSGHLTQQRGGVAEPISEVYARVRVR